MRCRHLFAVLLAASCFGMEPQLPKLLEVRRIYVDKLTGESSAQIRDMIINALQTSNLFVITEQTDKADAVLRGSAEDLIYTDNFQSSESINARASLGGSGTSRTSSSSRRGVSMGIGENESTKIAERKHEAMAAVRLVGKDGDVIWSTTQESNGAKFRGASADVADKVIKQLLIDIGRARNGPIDK